MKFFPVPVALTVVFLSIAPVRADNVLSQEETAMRKLGSLNGLALYCKSLKHVQTIKREIIQGVPKVRNYGEDFEEATNTSYLDAVTRHVSCPEKSQLGRDVAHAIAHMSDVFGKN